MNLRLKQLAARLGDAFWAVPAAMVIAGGGLALACVALDLRASLPSELLDSPWVYGGGPTGARTLLGAVAASAFGVAGTVFSITIAALSLAAGQMGPRLLRNFVRDRGNQVTLGTLLGTYTYALMVLRSVRATEEGGFTPHLAMTVAILLALCSVVMLIYFVGHVAVRINVDTVIALVGDDLRRAMLSLDGSAAKHALQDDPDWSDAQAVSSRKGGYLQRVDIEAISDWSVAREARVRLTVRPGQFVFPGSKVAWVSPAVASADADEIIEGALAIGSERTPDADVEYAIRQLVEVGMRTLSPGINDPYSAISVIDRLGSALCELVDVRLPGGLHVRDGRVVLCIPPVDYDGLTDTMFHPLRQYGAASAMVLIRLMEVLIAVAECEFDPVRRSALTRHARLVMSAGQENLRSSADLADLRKRFDDFEQALQRPSEEPIPTEPPAPGHRPAPRSPHRPP